MTRLLIFLLLTLKLHSDEVSATVTATVYHAVKEQTNNDPTHTASMFKIDLKNPYRHRIIAVSRDLLVNFPFGTKVEVIGVGKYNGIYTVQDVMNKRYKKRVDILINEDMRIGKWDEVKIIKLE